MNKYMKSKILAFTSAIIIAFMATSCMKEPTINSLIGDDKKIDIKGSLMNGDMKNPNIEAGYWDKTVFVYFHGEFGDCEVSVSNAQEQIVFCDTIVTYPNASVRFYMGDLPLGRYHLVISNSIEEAEGWFYNFKIVAVKPK